MKRIDRPEAMRSAAMMALPGMALPARQVSPMMRPSRLRMQEMRCSVRSIPARLSSPNAPSCNSVTHTPGQKPRTPSVAKGMALKSCCESGSMQRDRAAASLHPMMLAGDFETVETDQHLLNGIGKVLLGDDIARQFQVSGWESGQGRPPQIHDKLHDLQRRQEMKH